MTRHLAKLLDAIWYLSMGLFLGLTGGLVLAVILTFRGARELDATPGVKPYSDPMFAAYHNDAVAGYIGQDLFMVGGTVALVLFTIAILALATREIFEGKITKRPISQKVASMVQAGALAACGYLLVKSAFIIYSMNKIWPTLYDPSLSEKQLIDNRELFDSMHLYSEISARFLWVCAFIALAVTPWCRRISDATVKEPKEPQQQ